MIKKVINLNLFLIFLGLLNIYGQPIKNAPDTIHINLNDLKSFNYRWKSDKLIPTKSFKNTGLKKVSIDSFSELLYKKESSKLIFDTILHKNSWLNDTSLQKTLLFPQPIPIEKPKYKDYAISDIQYIDVDQGLSSSYILSILKDSRNMLWFGTFEGGLIRYNGYSMYNFTEEQGLSSNSIRSLYEDSKGNIWIGTTGQGVQVYDGIKIHDLGKIPELKELYVTNIEEDANGRIWLSTQSQGVFIIENNYILQLNTKNILSDKYIHKVDINKHHDIWIDAENGLALLRNDSLWIYKFEMGSNKKQRINTIESFDEDYTLIGTNSGLLIFADETYTMFDLDIDIRKIVKDSMGRIWLASDDDGVFELSIERRNGWKVTYQNYTEQTGLSKDDISDIIISNDILWVATFGGGVNKISTNSFSHITTRQGIGNDLVYRITEDKNKRIWYATEKMGIAYMDDNKFYHITDEHSLISSHIALSLCKDENSNIWAGFYKGGLVKFTNQTIQKLYIEGINKPLSVISILHDSKQRTWFGTFNQGVFVIDNNKITQYSVENGLLHNDVFDIYEDNNGLIWFATEEGLSIKDEEKFYNYKTQSGLPSNEAMTITGIDNSVWVGTYGGGIAIFKDGEIKVINISNGLSSNLITSIIQDDQRRVWVGTETGLNILNWDEKTGTYHVTSLGKEDGLKGVTFLGNSSFIDSKNNIWLGTGKGITYLNLNNYSVGNTVSKVEIEAIQVKQEFIDFFKYKDSLNELGMYKGIEFSEIKPFRNYPEHLTISFDKRHVTFYFAAIDQSSQLKNNYVSRLLPLEKEWSLPSPENKVDYRRIPPGEYQFEVRAVSKSGIYGEKTIQHLYIRPPWWMTQWMYVVYVVLLILFAGLLHRWRTSILKRRQYELESIVKERTIEIQEKNEELNVLLDQITDQRNEIQTQRDMVVQQKDQLEHINLSISQSIDYAKRIQASLMPKFEEFSQVFDDSFLIFKPRDIVSGDFFWWAELEGKILIVAADCTGHGVPGAFMSVLGTTFLREIILKERVLETHEILNRLREEIIQALKQKNIPGELRDGIEMTVVSIDKKTQRTTFSGAYNSIYHFKEGELNEIKGQKFPVAAYPGMKEFISTEFEIHPGDSIYMFSDGFQDQFGGERGKKIKKSRFFSKIEEVASKEMKHQKQELLQFFENWKGDYEQIDDILVLGFRIPNSF